MIPAPFDYLRPSRIEEVSLALADGAPGEVAILAGGQSLLTRLKLRQARPGRVVDLAGVAELRRLEVSGDTLFVGAMVRQAELLRQPFVRDRLPLLVQAGAAAADPMVRNRGTLVGALCEADPAGDWAAAALALDAELHLAGPDGRRALPLADFIGPPAPPALRRGEFVIGVSLPAQPEGARAVYLKRKHHGVGWSIASLALLLAPDATGRCAVARVAAAGAPAWPRRLAVAETALLGRDLCDPGRLASDLPRLLPADEARSDRWASAAYRAEMLQVLLRRGLAEIAAPAASLQPEGIP